jgi:hypothetical protein
MLHKNSNKPIEIIYNSLNRNHMIDKDHWTVSTVTHPSIKECYIIIEGIDENQKRVILRAELGNKLISNHNGQNVFDETKSQVYLEPATFTWLKELADQKLYRVITADITPEIKQRLLERIESDKNKELNYSNPVGRLGEVDYVGSIEAPIEKRDRLFKSKGAKDGRLKQNELSAKWVIDVLRDINDPLKDIDLSRGQLLTHIAKWENVSSIVEEEHPDTKGGCNLS